MVDHHLSLLPSGLVDLLPPDAALEADTIASLMAVFQGYGYDRIKPPLIEFEDSLLAPGPGAALANDTFRLMDPASHRMMGVRSDVTPQIGRIARSRLGQAGRPLRLCYANDVLRVKSSQMRTERQFTQVGCELVGVQSQEGDVEAIMLAVIGLKNCGVSNITVNLSLPFLLRGIVNWDENLEKANADIYADIYKALYHKDKSLLDQSAHNNRDILKSLMMCSTESDIRTLADAHDVLSRDLQQLLSVTEICASSISECGFDDVSLTFDLVESRGFDYHSGIAFTLFAKNAKGEIGRGGRYDITFDGASETAIGFTLYMDTVRKALPPKPQSKNLGVDQAVSWEKMEKLRQDGWIISRHDRDCCTHRLNTKTNEIEEL